MRPPPSAIDPVALLAPPLAADSFYTVPPCRVLDTRTTNCPVLGNAPTCLWSVRCTVDLRQGGSMQQRPSRLRDCLLISIWAASALLLSSEITAQQDAARPQPPPPQDIGAAPGHLLGRG